MVKFEISAVLLIFVCQSLGLQLPRDFKRCPKSSPNMNDCLKVAVQEAFRYLEHGIPSLNFPEIEPIRIPVMTIGEGKGTVHVVQNYKNVNVYGISKTKVKSIDYTRSYNGSKMIIDGFINEIRLEADYKVNGQILILPVYGEGKCVITLTNTSVITEEIIKYITKKETMYARVEDLNVSINPEKVHFQFDNLFNGDKVLGDQINNVLNDEFKGVFEDIREQYEKAFGLIFKSFANLIYEKVPLNEIYP